MPDNDLQRQWEQLQAERAEARIPERRNQIGEQAGLGARASSLVADEKWDWLLRHMHQEMDLKRKDLEATMALLVNPSSGLSDLEAMAVRQKGMRLQTELAVFEYLSGLPAKLIAEGKQALKELKLVDGQ